MAANSCTAAADGRRKAHGYDWKASHRMSLFDLPEPDPPTRRRPSRQRRAAAPSTTVRAPLLADPAGVAAAPSAPTGRCSSCSCSIPDWRVYCAPCRPAGFVEQRHPTLTAEPTAQQAGTVDLSPSAIAARVEQQRADALARGATLVPVGGRERADEAVRGFAQPDAEPAGGVVLGRMRQADAVDRVRRHASPEWTAAARRAVREVVAVGGTFTTDDVWRLIDAQGGSTHENRALGAVMRWAQAERLCEPTDRTQPSERAQNHARPVRVWRAL